MERGGRREGKEGGSRKSLRKTGGRESGMGKESKEELGREGGS